MGYDPFQAKVGERIIKRREELNMSASELAIQLDLSFSQVSRYESGQSAMSVAQLCQVAKILKVPLSYFQPKELDQYSAVPASSVPLLQKLDSLPMEKKLMMINMFEAQLDSLNRQ